MATGLGKTYLAGFFGQEFKRILFVAHREEILHQAKKSFQLIMPKRYLGFYNGQEKDTDADCIFASIDTLLFVRPTESFAVFTQQVGRALRLFDGKSYCTIIDLIGNYRNVDLKLS